MVKGKAQLSIKGRQWQHAAAYWPALVVGIVDTEAGAATAPTADQWVLYERKNKKRKKGGEDKENGEGADSGGADGEAVPGHECVSEGDEGVSANLADDQSVQDEELDALFDGGEDGDYDEVLPVHQPT